MIRDHLLNWRKNCKAANMKEYLDAVALLPQEDHAVAIALWGTPRQCQAAILCAFNDVEHYLPEMRQVNATN
jgi:hypothetical protein